MTDQYLVHSYADQMKRHILIYMEKDNLVALIEILTAYEDMEPDPRLKEGEMFSSDGSIVIL